MFIDILLCSFNFTVLLKIYFKFDISLQDLVDPGEACPGPTGNISQYQLSFQTGSVFGAENVNIARCTAGGCSHTFEPPSNPPSSYDSVSVAAENVLGVGAARTCTSQTISECYYYMFSAVVRLHKVRRTRYTL